MRWVNDLYNVIAYFGRYAIEQVIGCEGETAILLFSLSVSQTLRIGGFAPRYLSRWATFLYLQTIIFVTKILRAVFT